MAKNASKKTRKAEAGANYDAAYEHAVAGRIGEAETTCRKILASDPRNAKALHFLGQIAVQSGNVPAAIGLFNRVLEAKPGLATAHYNLGVLLLGQGETEEAVNHFEKAIESEPDFVPAHNNLGIALYSQGKLEEAITSFQKAVALKPNYADAHINLGNALKDQRKLAAAIASYQKAIALKPNYADAHNNLGNALAGLGRLDEAIASYRRALEIDPDHFGTHFNYAMDHRFFPGDPELDKLQALLEREDISEAQRTMTLFALGKAHDDIGLYAEAFSYYRQANEEKDRQVNFDPSKHQNKIKAIKDVFRERHDCAGESSGDSEHVAIFVIGMSRSGKTSVESLLSQHEDVFAAGENHEWTNAIQSVFDKHSIPETLPSCMAFLSNDHIREIGKTYIENMIKISPESKFFINTMPGNYRNIGMILQAIPTAKIVYCRRDPIDNCLFVYFHRYTRGHYYSYDLSNLASYYADYQDLMAHWQRLYGDLILSVRYEDLVRNPAKTGAGIYEYCGLEFDPTAIRVAFTTDEIGHWKHYEPYLDTVRQALGGLTR